MNNILQTFDLSKRFRNTVVLDRMNLNIAKGSVYGLLGQNGVGKTTAIKMLMNLVKASDGCAEIFGHDSRQLSAEDFTQIGYVSESQDQPDWVTSVTS